MAIAVELHTADSRSHERDTLAYCARAFGPDAQPLTLFILNLSAAGLMARSPAGVRLGDRLRVVLPVVGVVVAEIRWARGGQIGCELDVPIAHPEYYELLAVLLKLP